MSDEDREINARVVWSQTGQDEVSKTPSVMTQNQRSYNTELQKTEASWRSLRMSGRELGQISREMLVAGAALTGALVLDANNYVKTVGQTTAIGAAWIDNTNKIKQANLEIGQTTAGVMLPAYQQLGGIIQTIAGIVQQNPWMVSTALTAGGILTAVGTLGTVVSSVIRVVSDAGLLIDKITGVGHDVALDANTVAINANTAAQGGKVAGEVAEGAAVAGGEVAEGAAVAGGGLSALGVGAAPLIGTILGGAGYQAYASATGKPGLNQFATVGAYGLGKLGGKIMGDSPQQTEAEADIMAGTVGKWTGALTDNSPLAKKAADLLAAAAAETAKGANGLANNIIPASTVSEFTSYEQQITSATQTYEAQRTSIIENAEETIVSATATYEAQRATDDRNYSQQLARDQRNFQQQQANAAASHNLELQKMAQNYSDQTLTDAQSRDALALVKDKHSYDEQVSQSNAQYDLQQAQARQSYANELADQKQAHDNQEADQKAAYDKQIKAAKAQEEKQLKAQDAAYDKQLSDYQTAFVDKINAINSAILGDSKAYEQYLADQSKNFQSWISNYEKNGAAAQQYAVPVGSNPGSANPAWYGRQGGGWVAMHGPGEDGKPEYVISNPVAMALQSKLGGLSQAGIMSAIMAGRGGVYGGSGGSNVNITVQGGSLTMSQVYTEMDNMMNQKLGDLLPSFGA